MICVQCRARHHERCPGGNWCDCQHHAPPACPAPATEAESDGTTEPDAAEPAVNWVRQG